MLDKELASQLTKQEKNGIEYHFLELLPKIVESQHCVNSGFIEGASKELINTLAKAVLSFREEDEKGIEDDKDSIISDDERYQVINRLHLYLNESKKLSSEDFKEILKTIFQ